jgi:hypothetical protein
MGWGGLARIGVEKASHHLSQNEIAGDNPCSQHLSKRYCSISPLISYEVAYIQMRLGSIRDAYPDLFARDGISPGICFDLRGTGRTGNCESMGRIPYRCRLLSRVWGALVQSDVFCECLGPWSGRATSEVSTWVLLVTRCGRGPLVWNNAADVSLALRPTPSALRDGIRCG